ncbi:type IV secretion system DNA-binding domain-containing protein [Escherichia coli]
MCGFSANELPTLHKLPDLVEILPEARKFGGCYVFGIQSYAQLEDIYGERKRQPRCLRVR